MPYALVYLVLPLILHEQMRNSLPRSISMKMHAWLTENPWVRIEFGHHTKNLMKFTNEALIFAIQRNTLVLDELGNLRHVSRRQAMPEWPANSETADCLRRAALVGKWFAESGDIMTIYTMFGIRP